MHYAVFGVETDGLDVNAAVDGSRWISNGGCGSRSRRQVIPGRLQVFAGGFRQVMFAMTNWSDERRTFAALAEAVGKK